MDEAKRLLYEADEILLQAFQDRDMPTKDNLIILAGRRVIEALEILENETK